MKPRGSLTTGTRGQTLIGFIALVGTFVVAIALVFGFVGGLDTGSVVSGADTTEEASLTATTVTTDVLGASDSADSQPHALSHDRVVQFFDPDTDPSPGNLPQNESVNIRVTLEHTGGLTAPPAFEGNSTLTAGATPPTPDVVSARTTQATLDGKRVTITVETWP